MAICIPQEIIDKVREIVSQEDSEGKKISSIERERQLTNLLGDEISAKDINLLYEKSLLLKNQEIAINKFIDNLGEKGLEKKAKLKERISQRLKDRTEKIQNEELLSISQEIYNSKYGLDISLEDMKTLNKIKIERDALKEKAKDTVNGSDEKMNYGRKAVEMSDFINNLKNPSEKFGLVKTIKKDISDIAGRFGKKEGNIVSNFFENAVEAVRTSFDLAFSSVSKSFNAAIDIGATFRQGLKVLSNDPKIWFNVIKESLEPFKKIIKMKDADSKKAMEAVFNEFKARLVSDNLYEKAMDSKLPIGVIEDYFPTSLAEKLPFVGRLFKASNEAFTIFSQGSRFELFKKMYYKNEYRMTTKLAKDLAEVASTISGRGYLGSLEGSSGTLNRIFYSVRYIKSAFDVFYKPLDFKLDPVARMEATKSSIKILSTIGTLMYTASLFTDVGTNPIDSKFGKARIPGTNRWVDLTGGLGSYITFAARQYTGKSMSADGKITDLDNPKYGEMNRFDVFTNWSTNKLAPPPSNLVQFMKGKDFSGKKPTITSALFNMYSPMSPTNIWGYFNDPKESDEIINSITSILDISGFSVTDYNKK